ncbi:glycosyltransferase family 4 protein [Calothrix sp. FACHB-1219]|uniref:glycosyltransferase family 4 protein n=1 Tax=unclassified Calothrix TaxID=2619626 RepID=UPI001685190C|nr:MULTISPECIES: glycosyltransferase family 4 protein [unclassified Calothrix]MBD2201195.1 glycosyltransferase family 4 protein [Calothrix sp. FACHB-168]MBD2215629.1 glycosyltransferase family 4 protein [Calothrix sp. FACHB-1219]
MTFSEWLKKSLLTKYTNKGYRDRELMGTDREFLSGEEVNFEDGRQSNSEKFSTFVYPSIISHQSLGVKEAWYDQSLNLSVITEFFPPDYAATGQLIEELVSQLSKQGVNIEVFTGQPGYAFGTSNAPTVEQVGRVRIQRSRSAQLWSRRVRGKAINGILFTLRAVLHLIRCVRRRNLLLLTSAPPFLPIVGYIAHLCFGLSYVCLIYDIYPDIAIALGVIPKNHWLGKFWQALNQKIWQKSQGVIVLSPAMKQRLVSTCPEIADKVSVIHSWGDPELIVPIVKKDNWFAKKYNLVNKFTVLYSGNMGRCHDLDTILAAAKQLQNEPIQFVCIGGGPKHDSFIEEVNHLGLSNFLFLPYQEKHILPYSLTACDLSLVSVEAGLESLVAPSKLYPALATGRPVAVICSQSSYLRQLITEAKCGDSFENGDSYGLAEFIRLLSNDQKLAENMGMASRKYLQSHFTPEIIAKQYLKVLQKAVSSSVSV